MAFVYNSSKISIEVTPLFDTNTYMKQLVLTEGMNGVVPQGFIIVKYDKNSIDLLNDELKINIQQDNGYKQLINAYVYKREILLDDLKISFICVDKDFTRASQTSKFTSIKNALGILYKGTVDSNTESDIVENIEIHQFNESNFKLLNKILRGYKKNTNFAYLSDRLKIFDLNDFNPVHEVGISASVDITQPYGVSKVKQWDLETKKGYDGTYIGSTLFDSKVIYYKKEFQSLIENYMYNEKYNSTYPLNFSFKSLMIEDFSVLDYVKVRSQDIKVEKLLCSSRVLNIETNKIECTYSIVGFY